MLKRFSFGEILIVVKQSAQRHLRVRARLKCKHFSDTDWYPNHRTVTCQVRAPCANLTGRVRARENARARTWLGMIETRGLLESLKKALVKISRSAPFWADSAITWSNLSVIRFLTTAGEPDKCLFRLVLWSGPGSPLFKTDSAKIVLDTDAHVGKDQLNENVHVWFGIIYSPTSQTSENN